MNARLSSARKTLARLSYVRHEVSAALHDEAVQLFHTVKRCYWLVADPREIIYHGIRIDLDRTRVPQHLRDFFYHGLYEEPERAILDATLLPSDSYLEIGGGIGYLTAHACNRVGDAKVLVFEANPELAPIIAETAARHGFRPTITNAVLGDVEGFVDFFIDPNFTISSLHAHPDARLVTVPSLSFARTLARAEPTYLMVDIEGAEATLLVDTAIPDCVRAICVEVHPQVTGVEGVSRMLHKLLSEGFTLDLAISRQNVAFFSR